MDRQEIKTRYNMRLAQWRVTWLIEHSISQQHLWHIVNFMTRNPLHRQVEKRCASFRKTAPKNQKYK